MEVVYFSITRRKETNAIMMILRYLQDKMNFKDVRVSVHTFLYILS